MALKTAINVFQRQYTFTQAVPNVPQTTQFIVGQPQPQQQTGAQQQPTPTVTSYPFFPPNNVSAAAAAVMHSWPGNPVPYFDPGTVSRCLDAADQLIHVCLSYPACLFCSPCIEALH